MTENCKGFKHRHTFGDFLYWNLMLAIPLLTACVAIAAVSIFWLGAYLLVGLACILVLYRFFCSHCPHYVRGQKTVKCLFLWGVPKFFEPRRLPLDWYEKGLSLLAGLILILFPVYWLLDQPGLLVVYVFAVTAVGLTLRRNECSRCIYVDCPSNRVPADPKAAAAGVQRESAG